MFSIKDVQIDSLAFLQLLLLSLFPELQELSIVEIQFSIQQYTIKLILNWNVKFRNYWLIFIKKVKSFFQFNSTFLIRRTNN